MSFKRNRAPGEGFVKHKYHQFLHGGMKRWGVYNWYNYSQVIIWISVRAKFTINIIRDIHTNSVDFVLSYIQNSVKSEILMEPPIGFGVEGSQPI